VTQLPKTSNLRRLWVDYEARVDKTLIETVSGPKQQLMLAGFHRLPVSIARDVANRQNSHRA
jgi:hypothetical protein